MSDNATPILHKAFVVFTVGLLLGFGLCGLDYYLASRGMKSADREFGVGPLDGISLVTMGLSFLGLILTVVVWILSVIVSMLIAKPADKEPTRLFGKDDE